MTSAADRHRREDTALLHAAAERLRASSRRQQANGAEVPGWVWPLCALLDSHEWAIGRGTLDSQVRAAALEVARRIVADTGG